MRRSAPRPRQPFLDDKGRTTPARGADTVRPDRVPPRAGDHRPATLRRWERFTGADRRAGRQDRRRRVTHRRDRPRQTDRSGFLRVYFDPTRRRDQPAPTGRRRDRAAERSCRTPCSGSVRSPPIRCASVGLRRRSRCTSRRLRRRSDALRELEHRPAVHPPVVARRSPRLSKGPGKATIAILDTGDPGRRGPDAERRRLRRDRHALP